MKIRVIIFLLAVVGLLTANMLAAQSVQYTDTALMLSKYLRKSDTAQLVVPYLRKSDTTNLVSKYLRKTDTANLVNRYLRKTDTASMLLPYLRRGSMVTLNFVPKLTSLNTIGNSQIFDNGTNVGIGTASPSHRLDINGNARILNYLFSSFNNEILAGVDNSGYYFGTGNHATSNIPIYIGDRASGIILKTSPSTAAGTEKMRITSGGNVGIGTTNPASNFVVSNAGASGLEINPTGGVGSGVLIQAYNRNMSAYIPQSYYALAHTFNVGIGGATRAVDITSEGNMGIGTANPGQKLTVAGNIGTPNALLESTSTNVNFGTITAGYLAFLAGSGAERMRITSGGNALINTNSDNGIDKLQVNGSGKFSNNLTANNFIKAGGTSSQYLMADGSISTLPSFMGGSGTLNYIPKLTGTNSIGNSQIFDDGTNVAIGSTSNSYKLAVVVPPSADRDIFLAGMSGVSNGFTIKRVSSSFVYSMIDGNVGIGTSSPSVALHVSGASNLASRIRASKTSSGTIEMGADRDTYNSPYISALTNSNLDFFTNDTHRMRITSAGNVGIGTASPTEKLHVLGDALISNPSNAFLKVNSTSGIAVLQFTNGAGTQLIYGGAGGSNNMDFYTNSIFRMRIDPSGNVGIGSSPLYKLQVYNATNGTTAAFGGASYGLRIDNGGTFSSGRTTIFGVDNSFYGSYQPLSIEASTLALQTLTGGNVGIGTTSPGQKLEVFGNALINSNTNTELKINSNGGAASLVLSNGAGSQSIYGGVGGSNNMDFYTNSIFRMRIDPSGNVGIGTTAPGSYKLAVEGTIGARKMKITQTGIPWADYVFQDDYQLRSLEALDKYIQQYKHLPEVPTTKEVNENGLDVADTQALLLKKIEELTLYMIELKKQNEQLTNRVKKLEKK